ncbi:hypothetical protein [Streptomyces albireticuli]|uniref:hypothetical protein n=1 Tax=Streptomyces albireticuli TaxID=1940 RepID=UPI0036C5EE6F
MRERFDLNDRAYAPADSLQGLLQRGRGAGALRALDEPETAAGLVRDAVRRDWRWDSVDDRHLYLARLVHALSLPLDPLLGLLAGDEDECERATRVLELLALAGSAEARAALRAYVRDGEHWADVLESVADAWPVEWWDDLAEVARVRSAGEEPPAGDSEPWARWGTGARPAAPRRTGPHTVEVGPGDRRLLSVLADAGAADGAKAHALHTLAGRPPEPGLLPLVPGLGTADGERPLPWLGRAVERLGALAVPAARAWAVDGREWLSWTGLLVLARHGEARDLPTLIGELTVHEATRRWCGPGPLASGLARFGPAAAEAAPVLHRLWLRTPHSYERPALLGALAAVAPAGLGSARAESLWGCYTESLWDCEAEARLLGIASAPDLPRVHRRLAELRDDAMEEREVRAAAGARLAAGRHGSGRR